MNKKQIVQLNVNMPVALIKEGTAYVAWTPALDIATSGKTESEAKKNFDELVSIFFEEFIDNPTGLEVVLESMGWTKQRQKWTPPKVTNTIQNVSVNLAV
jgi:predicted RNase H-like HicB family nuclease